MATARNSDRWLTPGVIIAALIVGGLVVASVVGSVAYLTARGIDPDPMLKLAGTLVAAAGSVGTFVLQLGQRAQNSKTERNTGMVVSAVDELAAVVSTVVPPSAHTAPPAYERIDVDEHLADDEPSTRVAVPAIPPMPEHLRRGTKMAR